MSQLISLSDHFDSLSPSHVKSRSFRPEDSFVVTMNAAEFQTSSGFQAGLTLRFPRITKYRGKADADPKDPDDIEHWGALNQLFEEQEETRQNELSFGLSQSQTQQQRASRFLTAKQLQASGRNKSAKNARKQTNEVKHFHIPNAAEGNSLSNILDGFIFNVLPGSYRLANDGFASAEAERDGWATEVKSVRSHLDVIKFIQSHGGSCQLNVHEGTDILLGGSAADAKVSNLIKLMEVTDVTATTKKDAEARRLVEMGGVL